jgi:deazaflavin-dependent oxidoreductase (nitroreductase family)
VTTRRGDRLAHVGASLLRVRWFVRAPIVVYRTGFGLLFGRRLLMLEHIGRTSGNVRYVVLEVIDHPSAGRFVVVAGFGERAQWLKNVRHNPRVRVYIGSAKPVPAIARPLSAAEAAEALERYAAAHPRAWNSLRPVLEETLGARIDAEGTSLPMVALDMVDLRAA